MPTSSKSIVILLPGRGGAGPQGGYKVAYEYANRLVADGYDVTVVYPAISMLAKTNLKTRLKAIPKALYNLPRSVSCRSWFNLDPRVKEKLTFTLRERFVPRSDFYIATSISTAIYLHRYNISSDRKLYLIQGFENWAVSDKVVYESYRYGFKNIVISDWLAKEVAKTGANYTVIKNGFDFDYFKLTVPIERKNPYCISMLYHKNKLKGCSYGIEALTIVKQRYPQLKALFFGVPERPANLPEWIEYYRTPDCETHNRIYNESAIYLAPSLQEGWGLTVGEALICGAAVVCTEAKGFKEMVTDGETALICPVSNSRALADSIIRLIDNPSLRISMARKGNAAISQFTWDASYDKLKHLLEQEATTK